MKDERTIRISRGVGSSPKLWAVLTGHRGNQWQVGEFDISDEPGWYDREANGINGMSGIIWAQETYEVLERLLYDSVEDWVADIADEYPGVEIIRDDDEPLRRKAKANGHRLDSGRVSARP